jgi:hypothetical protein
MISLPQLATFLRLKLHRFRANTGALVHQLHRLTNEQKTTVKSAS